MGAKQRAILRTFALKNNIFIYCYLDVYASVVIIEQPEEQTTLISLS